MNITQRKLKQIITEEVRKALLVEYGLGRRRLRGRPRDLDRAAFARVMTDELMRMEEMIQTNRAKLNCIFAAAGRGSSRALSKCANVKLNI